MAILTFSVVEMNRFSTIEDCDDVAMDSAGSNIIEEGTKLS
jgi:hypothetical protein